MLYVMSDIHQTHCTLLINSILVLFVIFECFMYRRTYGFQGPPVYQVTQPFGHAEGPIWDSRKQLLYFVDIFEGQLLSYNPETYTVNSLKLPGTVAPVIPTKSNPNRFIIGVNRSLLSVEWDGSSSTTATRKQILTEVSKQYPTSRFNDGKADKKGRLWVGTMGYEDTSGVTPNQGVLHLIHKDNLNTPEAVIHPVTISNGLAWNKANDKFYYIDTPTRNVIEYDYNDNLGKISNPKVIFDMEKHDTIGGFPDGMTIDIDDNLWIALYWGGAVVKVNPKTGSVLQVIPIPAQCVSSVAWGGRNLDVLFVTTSRHALNSEERLKQPGAGSVFAISNLGTNGLPGFYADL